METNIPTEKITPPHTNPRFSLLDGISFALCLFLTYCFFASQPILTTNGDFSYGTTAAYWGLFALATAYICQKQKTFRPAAIPSGLCALLMSLSFSLHSNIELNSVLFLLLIPLSGIYCVTLTGTNLHPFGSFYSVLDVLHCELTIPLGNLFLPARAFRQTRRRSTRNERKSPRLWLMILLGVLVAVPLLLIVVPLLLDADAAFESIVGTFFDELRTVLERFGRWLEAHLSLEPLGLLAAVLFTPYIYAVMFAFANDVSRSENKDTSAKYRRLQKAPMSFLGTVLGVVCAVYLIYLFSQTAYFFSAFTGRLPFGVEITVAEYARRGFFETVKIAAVNFGLIATSVALTKRSAGQLPKPIKALNIFLCAFTILLCAISVSKIWLYVRAFELTEKRLYVFAVDLALIFVFLALLLRLCLKRFPYWTFCLCAVFSVAAILGVGGVRNIIAAYNVNAYLSGKIATIDVETLTSYQDAALPSLQKLADSKTKAAKDAQKALTHLYTLAIDPSYNRDSDRAAAWAKQALSDVGSFRVDVRLATDEPFETFGYTMESGGKTIEGGGVANADGTLIDTDYDAITLSLQYTRDQLGSKKGDSASLHFAFFRNDGETPICTIDFDANYGVTYVIDIYGSEEVGYEADIAYHEVLMETQ